MFMFDFYRVYVYKFFRFENSNCGTWVICIVLRKKVQEKNDSKNNIFYYIGRGFSA